MLILASRLLTSAKQLLPFVLNTSILPLPNTPCMLTSPPTDSPSRSTLHRRELKPARCERTDVRKLGEDASTLSDLRQRSDKRRSNKPMRDWQLGGNKLSWSAKSYTTKPRHLKLATMRARNPILCSTILQHTHT